MAIVQVKTRLGGGAGSTTITDSITVSNGSYLIIAGGGSAGGGATSDVYSVVAGGKPAFALNTRIGHSGVSVNDGRQMFFAGPFSAGSVSVTMTFGTSTTNRMLRLVEYAGGLPVLGIGTGQAAATTGTDNVTTGNFVTPYDDCNIVGFSWNQDVFTNWVAGTGMTMDDNGSGAVLFPSNDAVAHKAAATKGTYASTWTRNAPGSGACTSSAVVMCENAAFLAGLNAAAVTFPITPHASGKYFVDAGGTPFPIKALSCWYYPRLSAAEQLILSNDWVRRGGNAIQIMATLFTFEKNNAVDSAGNLPFTHNLAGGAWSGQTDFTTPSTQAPDLATPNSTYWAARLAELTALNARGIMVQWAVMWGGGGDQELGLWETLLANGTTKSQNFGAYLADLVKGLPNLLFILGGDTDADSKTTYHAVLNAMRTGMQGVGSQQSSLHCWHLERPAYSQEDPTFGADNDCNGIYAYTTDTYSTTARAGWNTSVPGFQIETAYEIIPGSPWGDTPNAIRHTTYSMWMNAPAGATFGSEGYWGALPSTWFLWVLSPGFDHAQIRHALIDAVQWWKLKPSGLDGMQTLIAPGRGTIDTADGVEAAAAADGTVGAAYVPTSATTFSYNMTVFSGGVLARWVNPTTGAYTNVGVFSNSGSHAFTNPGPNGSGANDWLLLLETTPYIGPWPTPGPSQPHRRRPRSPGSMRMGLDIREWW